MIVDDSLRLEQPIAGALLAEPLAAADNAIATAGDTLSTIGQARRRWRCHLPRGGDR